MPDPTTSEAARVPTALVQRQVRPAAQDEHVLLRVGPYGVVRPLVRAPGAFLAQAVGPNQEPVLLQMTPLRAAQDDTDAAARHTLERGLAAETAALFAERDITVMAHGAATRDDGARVLFWALPWRPSAERLGNPALYVEGAEHLLILALSLARRLARRHVLGGLEPLLSEHLVAVQSTEAEPIGVPVSVAPEWLAPEAPAPRWAPEERAAGGVRRTGDLWRLGYTLRALASAFDTVPQGLDRLVRRLCEEAPKDRPPRATEVVVELEAIHAALGRGLPLVPLEGTPTVSMQALPLGELSVLMQSAVGHTTCEIAPDPALLLEVTLDTATEPTLRDLPRVELEKMSSADTLDCAPMQDGVPPWAFFFTLDELRDFLRLVAADLERRELRYVFGTGLVQLSLPGGDEDYYLGLVPLAHACHGAPKPRWRALVRHELDSWLAATAADPERARFRAHSPAPRTPSSEDGPLEAVPRVDGGSGPTRLLPTVEPSEPPAPVVVPRPRTRWYVLGGVLALTLFAAVVAGASRLDPRAWRVCAVDTRHEVELRTQPPGAVVVAEDDGRLLGRAPQRFWVGPQVDARVLVSAPGYEPRRVVLPADGRVEVAMTPISEDAERCGLDLPPAEVGRYEAVGATFQTAGRLAVRGAAIVRARGPEGAGAWIVRCGSARVDLGGPDLATVSLELPAADVAIEGRPIGDLSEVEVRGAFSCLTVDGRTRWLPTGRPVRLMHSGFPAE